MSKIIIIGEEEEKQKKRDALLKQTTLLIQENIALKQEIKDTHNSLMTKTVENGAAVRVMWAMCQTNGGTISIQDDSMALSEDPNIFIESLYDPQNKQTTFIAQVKTKTIN